ncbi:MAG TPA: YfiR family protein [Chthoniobacterales bacterium]|nr:YfiR family protein [Chthoniobacterales bacterium]
MEFLRSRKLIACLASLSLLASPAGGAAHLEPSEYGLKSVFLYQFCRFMEWPASAFSSSNDPLIIGVYGTDPFGSLLKEAVQGETYHGRPIRIEYYHSPREIRRCHILFVSRSEADELNEVLAAVAGKHVVTVGETDGFLDRGGMIALTAERNRVRLRVNTSSLRAANVDVSSKLLRVAEIKG